MGYLTTKFWIIVTCIAFFTSCAAVKISDTTFKTITAGRKTEKDKMMFSFKLRVQKTSSISSFLIDNREMTDNVIAYAIPSGKTFKATDLLPSGSYTCQIKTKASDWDNINEEVKGHIKFNQKGKVFSKTISMKRVKSIKGK